MFQEPVEPVPIEVASKRKLCHARAGAALLAFLLLAIQSCALPNNAPQNVQAGWQVATVESDSFKHYSVRKPGNGDLLLVFIEGDGTPWRNRYQVALDPSPDRALMLDLMEFGSAPALFLGRPCYFTDYDPACTPNHWTNARYSTEVVNSMNQALDELGAGFDKLVLVGHSGGGTLAWLLATERHDVIEVLTLAGNLDTQAWAKQHNYHPLQDSLNPAGLPPLTKSVRQTHFLGTEDNIIEQAPIAQFVTIQGDAQLVKLANVNHRKGWKEHWPKIYQRLMQSALQETQH